MFLFCANSFNSFITDVSNSAGVSFRPTIQSKMSQSLSGLLMRTSNSRTCYGVRLFRYLEQNMLNSKSFSSMPLFLLW